MPKVPQRTSDPVKPVLRPLAGPPALRSRQLVKQAELASSPLQGRTGPLNGNTKIAICGGCGKHFVSRSVAHIYCTSGCRDLATRSYPLSYESFTTEEIAERDRESDPRKIKDIANQLRGFYVYGWFDKDIAIPFYVGKGIDGRAWVKHTGKNASPELVRQRLGNRFKVLILQDGLTSKEARRVESILIGTFWKLGGARCNLLISSKDGEVLCR